MDNSEVSRFHIVDYIVFCGMLIVSLGIGLWQGCKGDRQSTTQQYLMANRQLHLIPAALSIAGGYLKCYNKVMSTICKPMGLGEIFHNVCISARTKYVIILSTTLFSF